MRKQFSACFSDDLSDFKMPKNLVVKLLSSLDVKEVELGKKILRPDDQVDYFYLIK